MVAAETGLHPHVERILNRRVAVPNGHFNYGGVRSPPAGVADHAPRVLVEMRANRRAPCVLCCKPTDQRPKAMTGPRRPRESREVDD
jgi:hypothetical protein